MRTRNQDKLNEKMEGATDILEDDPKFEAEFKKWFSGNQRWHKRTWVALRDYKKFK